LTSELTAELVHGFSEVFLKDGFDGAVKTPEFHHEMWEFACSPEKYVAIAAPRGHAKSTALTHVYTLAAVLFKHRRHVLLVSDTEGQAAQFLGDIKRELLENEKLKTTFGIRKFVKERETEIIVEMEEGYQFRIVVKGSEQKVRGIKWRNKRPDLIIGDDLENDEIVLNDDRRDKFRRWFFNALVPCGSDNCIVRIVGTILHLDSFLERLMPQLDCPYTIKRPLYHYSRKFNKPWFGVRYKGHPDTNDFSELLWPEKWSEKRYRRERDTYIEQGFPEGYSQEYLNYPIDEASAFFQPIDFLPILDEEEPLEYYIGVDLAISEKDSRAYTVFVVSGMNSAGMLKIVNVVRRRMDSLEIIDTLFNLHVRYKQPLIAIEQENIARSLGPIIESEQFSRGVFLNIEKKLATQDKMKRAQAIRTRMRSGGVQFDKMADWYKTFETELLQFPRGKYKDQVDALAWIGLTLADMHEAPTLKELKQQEWDEEEEWARAFDDDDNGTSWVTGY